MAFIENLTLLVWIIFYLFDLPGFEKIHIYLLPLLILMN